MKRKKHPILTAMGKLAERSIFKGKTNNKLRGFWRPMQRSAPQPLRVDYSHR